LRDLGSFNPELQLDLPDSVVDSRLMPANDEPDASLHAQEEAATIDESPEDASASLH
jgi:hypothetical protein